MCYHVYEANGVMFDGNRSTFAKWWIDKVLQPYWRRISACVKCWIKYLRSQLFNAVTLRTHGRNNRYVPCITPIYLHHLQGYVSIRAWIEEHRKKKIRINPCIILEQALIMALRMHVRFVSGQKWPEQQKIEIWRCGAFSFSQQKSRLLCGRQTD